MAILLALSANFVFSFASTLFSDFSREVSPKWINCFKATVAFICFAASALILRDGGVAPDTIPLYLLSGALGVFMADHFLCEAFSRLGAARSLMIFSFSPLFVAGWSYLFFGEALPLQKFIAILFFMACVLTVSFEKFRQEGHWESVGLLMAFCGVIFDGLANIVTSYAFKQAPENGVFSVGALRAGGGFLTFLLLSPYLKVHLLKNYQQLSRRKKHLALLASVLGTFVSLSLWLAAVKHGNLTTLVALSGITPLMAAFFEIMRKKTKATRYLLVAFIFFLFGFYFLLVH